MCPPTDSTGRFSAGLDRAFKRLRGGYGRVLDTLLPAALGGKPEEGREHFEGLAERAVQQGRSPTEYLAELTELECQARRESRISRLGAPLSESR